MMRKVFHILPEGERFSELRGGTVARWVANILREDPSGVVLAGHADTLWYPSEAVVPLPWLRIYDILQRLAGRYLPWSLRRRMLLQGLGSTLQRLRAGDVVWVHDRPETAAAVGGLVHRAGGTVVLHMHNGNVPVVMEDIAAELDVDRIVFAKEDRLSEEALESHGPGFRWGLVRLRYDSIVDRMSSGQRVFGDHAIASTRRRAGVLQSARG